MAKFVAKLVVFVSAAVLCTAYGSTGNISVGGTKALRCDGLCTAGTVLKYIKNNLMVATNAVKNQNEGDFLNDFRNALNLGLLHNLEIIESRMNKFWVKTEKSKNTVMQIGEIKDKILEFARKEKIPTMEEWKSFYDNDIKNILADLPKQFGRMVGWGSDWATDLDELFLEERNRSSDKKLRDITRGRDGRVKINAVVPFEISK